jgi:hypothetical protein
MTLRWDLHPMFPNAPEDSERALWTRRSVISASVAAIGLIIVMAQDISDWLKLVIVVLVAVAFDAGDQRNPYRDDEPDIVKPEWLYDESGKIRPKILEDGTIQTPHDRLYQEWPPRQVPGWPPTEHPDR